MPVLLEITQTPNIKTVLHGFNIAISESANLTPVMRAIGEEFRKVIVSALATEGGSTESGRFAALSEPYATRKRKRFGDKPILEATGRLKKALTKKTHGGDAVRQYGNGTLVFGTRGVAYALAHQMGCSKLPRRAFFDNNDDLFRVKGAVDKAVQRHLVNLARKAGFRHGPTF